MKTDSKLSPGQRYLPFVTSMIFLILTSNTVLASPDTVIVFIDNGGIQCEFKGHPLNVTSRILQDNGVQVLRSDCGMLTRLTVLSLCGSKDNNIHLHTIDSQDLAIARQLGFQDVSLLAHQGDKGYAFRNCPD